MPDAYKLVKTTKSYQPLCKEHFPNEKHNKKNPLINYYT